MAYAHGVSVPDAPRGEATDIAYAIRVCGGEHGAWQESHPREISEFIAQGFVPEIKIFRR